MVVWLTKYSLTAGIFQLEGNFEEDGKYFSGHGVKNRYRYFVRKDDVFETKELAEKDFEKRRLKKIAALQKKIEKLKIQKPKFDE